MSRSLVSLLCLTLVFSYTSCSLFRTIYTGNSNVKYQRDFKLDDLKEAHYFTDYLDRSDLEGARSNGLVDLSNEVVSELTNSSTLKTNFVSYAGYFTVNKQCGSNLYSWFFKNKVISIENSN